MEGRPTLAPTLLLAGSFGCRVLRWSPLEAPFLQFTSPRGDSYEEDAPGEGRSGLGQRLLGPLEHGCGQQGARDLANSLAPGVWCTEAPTMANQCIALPEGIGHQRPPFCCWHAPLTSQLSRRQMK